MGTFAEMKDTADSPELIRRALQGVSFLAPMETELFDSILDPANGGLFTMPTGWLPIGVVSTDGFTFSSDIDKTDTEAWGYSVPVRTDINKAPKQVKVTPLEKYRRLIQEVSLGMDLSTVAATTAGEVVFDEADLPESLEYRLFVLFMDGTVTKPFYRGKLFSRVKLAETGDEKWNTDDDATGQELTLDVLLGPEGFPVRHFMGGQAFDAVKYGFQAAPTP